MVLHQDSKLDYRLSELGEQNMARNTVALTKTS